MPNEREEGLAALQRGDFQTAAVHLEAATKADPGDFQAHLYLGGVFHQLERHADASRVLMRATELQPTSAQAHYNLGVAQEQTGEAQAAQTSFQKALDIQPEYAVAREALTRVKARVQGLSAKTGEGEEAPLYSAGAPGSKPASQSPAAQSVEEGENARLYSASGKSSFGSAAANPTDGGTPAAPSAPASAYGTPPLYPNGPQGATTPRPAPGLADYGQQPASNAAPPAYGQPPAAPYGQPAPAPYGQPAYGQPASPYGQPLDMAGNPMNMGMPGYTQPAPGSPPVPYGQQPGYASPRQQPYGASYGVPPPGYAPYGAGYAPPGSQGYGGAAQFVVPRQPCKEANAALVLSILGIVFVGLGVVLHPLGLYYAIRAKRMMAQNPGLTGDTEATVALVISSIFTALYAVVGLLIVLTMLATIR